jgi:hypothetical protein
MGPEAGGVCGGCGGPVGCSSSLEAFADFAAALVSTAVVAGALSAFKSSADSEFLFFINKIISNLSRSSADGTPASLFTSSGLSSPWLTIKRRSGSPGAAIPAAGAALGAVALADDDSLVLLAPLLLLLSDLLSDAKANTGRRNSARTPAQIRNEIRIMIEASRLVTTWGSLIAGFDEHGPPTHPLNNKLSLSVHQRTEFGS